jgi:hypothetical protein
VLQKIVHWLIAISIVFAVGGMLLDVVQFGEITEACCTTP